VPCRKATASHQKTPFSIFKKKFGGGNLKKSKGFFWRGAARLAVLGGGAELRHFAGNRFELGCKTPPEMDKNRKSGAKAPFFLWFCGANPRCFQWGENFLGQP